MEKKHLEVHNRIKNRQKTLLKSIQSSVINI
jgi:hypothetical protein